MLFSLYINDLLVKLGKLLGEDQVLAYADDVAIIFHTKDQLSRAMIIIETWCRENSMIVNKSKSGILYLQHQKGRKKNFGVELKGYPIV